MRRGRDSLLHRKRSTKVILISACCNMSICQVFQEVDKQSPCVAFVSKGWGIRNFREETKTLKINKNTQMCSLSLHILDAPFCSYYCFSEANTPIPVSIQHLNLLLPSSASHSPLLSLSILHPSSPSHLPPPLKS